ncbi:MAG TPA: PEP-CTERM sorting domain-containing protein [Tepidisphaeraceae bacterium]|nr:PEP-CTERM sorting domain-containing protein [Tepidisphaeraceae bacterium]
MFSAVHTPTVRGQVTSPFPFYRGWNRILPKKPFKILLDIIAFYDIITFFHVESKSCGLDFTEEGMKMHIRHSGIGCGVLLIGLLGVAPVHADLTHRYSFNDGTANDSVGSANGTLVNSATVSGGQLQLNNPEFSVGGDPDPNGYLSLPASILPSSGSATIEEWFTFQGSGFFAESYTFSNGNNDNPADQPTGAGGEYLIHAISAPQPVTPPGGANTGGDHVEQTINGYSTGDATDAYETTPNIGADGGGYLDDGETFMSATVIDAAAGTLSYYLYDVSAGGVGGLQETIAAIPLSDYNFTNAYLGRSPFLVDNATSGTIDEFRIYNNAQSGAAIAADYAAGPNVVLPVPEPLSLSILAVGTTALLLRRRNRGSINPQGR